MRAPTPAQWTSAFLIGGLLAIAVIYGALRLGPEKRPERPAIYNRAMTRQWNRICWREDHAMPTHVVPLEDGDVDYSGGYILFCGNSWHGRIVHAGRVAGR